MKKDYTKPEIDEIKMEIDVICASNGFGSDTEIGVDGDDIWGYTK